ncbi:MAG: DUF2917 domain-containing protein, partial [Burkholderiales bacterium]
GLLWVTQEGFARDDFLGPGVSVAVETAGAVLIEALCVSSATVDVDAQPAREPARLELTASSF